MNRDVKARWINALRNGGHVQARGTWGRGDAEDGMCCLNVLYFVETGALALSTERPLSDAGPTEFVHKTIGHEAFVTLTNMNDRDGRTFAQIADWVETNIPEDDQ